MTREYGRWAAIGITVVLGMWGAVQTAEAAAPGSTGLAPVAIVWVGILMTGLGVLNGFLPRVQTGRSNEDDG